MHKRYFSDKLVKWYEEHRRSLPWRDTKDPYRIWLSEIILQQTRVIQGLPYYEKFLQHYPSVSDLASAKEQEVLRLWQGLGYYSRARNLHKCARVIVDKWSGTFPDNYADLLTLPGIGEYTAAAIASFSFGEKVAVVDGNVFRVLARQFGIDTVINSPDGKKEFSSLANSLIPAAAPDTHNQAIMEFGAMHCTPRNPDCPACPIKTSCVAYEKGMQHLLPVKAKGKASRKRYFYYIVMQKGKSLAMKKRSDKDIWHGLFDFPLIESPKPLSLTSVLKADQTLNTLGEGAELTAYYKHVLTHQNIFARFVLLKKSSRKILTGDLQFYSPKEIADLPKPVLISRFLADQALL